MKLSIIILAILGITLPGMRTYSQSNARTECLTAMKEMVNKYQSSNCLSFTITYKYATEEQPGVYLDSLKGSYRLNGKNYWYSLDSTEVTSYQGTCVLLFKEDHIMYIVSSATRKREVDFLVAMDSLLSHMSGMEPVVSESASELSVKLSFGAGKALRSIEYTIDKNSGYLTRIREVVKSDQLYDPSVRGKIEGGVPYAMVDMEFSDYRTGGFDDSQLDTAQYFKKEGANYVSIAPYVEYKIFLGAPNL